MTQAERAVKAMYQNHDQDGTNLLRLVAEVGVKAVQAAIDAGLMTPTPNNKWLIGTPAAADLYCEKLRPKPRARRPKLGPRDPDAEETLIRARIGVELLQKARQGCAALEVRQTLKQIAHQQLEAFWGLKVTPRYQTEYEQINAALTELI